MTVEQVILGLGVALCTAFAVCAFRWAAQHNRQHRELAQRCTALGEATVVGVVERIGSEERMLYAPVLRMMINGRQYDQESRIGRPDRDAYQIGSRYGVCYQPDDPASFYLPVEVQHGFVGNVGTLFGTGSALCAVVLFLGIFLV